MQVNPKTLPGFMELLPGEQVMFNRLLDIIRTSYESFGFLPLDTPVMEAADVLLAKTGGDTEKQIYSFNKGDTQVALRFDLTVPLAKYVALYQHQLAFPFRRYQIGKVYRGERPQQGRFREFYQCDIDVIGDGELSLMYDAEIISVIYNVFKAMAIDDFTVAINNRQLFHGLFIALGEGARVAEILRIVDKKNKIGDEGVVNELQQLGVNDENVKSIVDFASISGEPDKVIKILKSMNVCNDIFSLAISQLEQVVNGAAMFGVPASNFSIDLTIARGLDYYTGTVYETFLNNHKDVGSVCSGGRYDNLSDFYTDRKMPGVGVSIGLTRLFSQLSKIQLMNFTEKSIADVIVIAMSENLEACAHLANTLRCHKINTEIFMENKKLKTKLAYADKLSIPFALLIGEEEIVQKKFSLKNLRLREQKLLTLEQIVDELTKFKLLENKL